MTVDKHIRDISSNAFANEDGIIKDYLSKAQLFKKHDREIFEVASGFVSKIRSENQGELNIENFLKEYSLSTYEGVAILCLAEALLRIPDKRTADELIRDKLAKGNWQKHMKSDSGFMLNVSSFAFLLSGEVLSLSKVENKLLRSITNIVERAGEPVIREAIKKGIELLGGKFVIGTNIEKALNKSDEFISEGYSFSYDMLGEGARTEEQAQKYLENYLNGTKKLLEHYKGKLSDNIYDNPNISVKLSALHPRYELLKKDRIFNELLPRLKQIVKLCKDNNLWVSIDAEESYRLEISLMLYQELLKDNGLRYDGLGFVVQGYGKRALKVINLLNQLAEENKIRIPIRLVKGAYWDSEIKYSQSNGLSSYPVFTRKSHTDLSYLVCAQEMMKKNTRLYPQFATHSAQTVASILKLAQENNYGDFEFQKLFGMGDDLYNQIIHKIKCRIYAPVGSYEELLPYLIRRILENGANNSFVSLVADKKKSLEDILVSPIKKIEEKKYTGKFVPEPADIYAPRKNSYGYCLGNIMHTEELQSYINKKTYAGIKPRSIIAGKEIEEQTQENTEIAVDFAEKNGKKWSDSEVIKRCELLENFANEIEKNFGDILNILVFEAKKTAKDAIGEIREAVDFIRFYSSEARNNFATDKDTRGYTGEQSRTNYRAKGIFVCISPWNFPMSIFLGQISAALLAGNPVIAKPAEQTTKIAYYLTQLAHKAGVPSYAFQLILGSGSIIGNALTQDERIAGVVFTGSTQTARIINRNLANRKTAPLATLIAETGGQNCMMVDSTVLLERTCDDIIESAFHSAGQRCSALRVCYIQEEIYNELTDLLSKAVKELKVGFPDDMSVDIPPIIDEEAHCSLMEHIEKMKAGKTASENLTIKPTIIGIESIKILEKENFGPILHLVKYKREDTDKIIEEINSTGYGLTFGIQSRVNDYINYVTSKIKAGNIYINRSTIGAVVETHPFGGSGLSGTGPKAGGHEYLKRFAEEYTITENTAAIGGNLELLS